MSDAGRGRHGPLPQLEGGAEEGITLASGKPTTLRRALNGCTGANEQELHRVVLTTPRSKRPERAPRLWNQTAGY
jgi:hypothetical protein